MVGVKDPVSANKGVNSPGSAYLPHVKIRLQREGAGWNAVFPCQALLKGCPALLELSRLGVASLSCHQNSPFPRPYLR